MTTDLLPRCPSCNGTLPRPDCWGAYDEACLDIHGDCLVPPQT